MVQLLSPVKHTSFDELDYQLKQAELHDIGLAEELRLVITPGGLAADTVMRTAKEQDLRKARHEMLKAIRAADAEARANEVFPPEAIAIVSGSVEEMVKV